MRTAFTVIFLFCCAQVFAGFKVNSFYTANGSNYDIIYHRISFTVNPAVSGAISNGSVTTYFRTTVANVTSLQFDLDGAMTVSSATHQGSVITKSHNTTTDILTLTIPNIAVAGTLDSVTVNYSGTPAAPLTSIPSGYNYVTHGASQKAIYTLDEAFTAHYWWPCKESLYDKIDSCVDLIVTAPNAYKVAGNGVVSTQVGATNTITNWKTFYGIATYGINFAVANYAINSSTLVTGGQTLNLYNYLYPEDNVPAYQNSMTDMKNILAMYVAVLGVNYPFLNEQYGMTECTGNWGALEVQSMTFMARGSGTGYSKSTIAHELSHQWFGDMLTTNSWQQIWLNEGFAQYCESVIYPENMLSAASAATSRSNLKASVNTTSSTFVTDTSNADKIFFGTATSQPYEKGAMTLSMLRAWLGDAKFFLALKNYLNAPGLKYKFSSVDSLKKYMQAETSLDMTNFFADWVNKNGKVTYTVKYQYVTKGVYIQLTTQSPTSAGAGYFDMPVPLQIRNSTGLDTTVVVIDKRGVLYNSVTGYSYGNNTIYYPLSQTPTIAPVFDPNNVVLATSSSTTASSSLNNLIILPFKDIKLTAIPNGKNIKINWAVNTDESLQSIIVECSKNSADFTTSKTFLVFQTNNLYEGSYTDVMENRIQYYRLKIVKKDGTYIYSKIEKVSNNEVKQVQVMPNPAQHELSVLIPAGFNDGELKMIIQNMSGQIVKEFNWNAISDTKILVSVKEFSPGNYNLVLINRNNERRQAGFIKQ